MMIARSFLLMLLSGIAIAANLDPATQKIVDDMKRDALIQEIGDQLGLLAQEGLSIMYRVDIRTMSEIDRGITEDIFNALGSCMVRDLQKGPLKDYFGTYVEAFGQNHSITLSAEAIQRAIDADVKNGVINQEHATEIALEFNQRKIPSDCKLYGQFAKEQMDKELDRIIKKYSRL